VIVQRKTNALNFEKRRLFIEKLQEEPPSPSDGTKEAWKNRREGTFSYCTLNQVLNLRTVKSPVPFECASKGQNFRPIFLDNLFRIPGHDADGLEN
jgi:hypothetical protein